MSWWIGGGWKRGTVGRGNIGIKEGEIRRLYKWFVIVGREQDVIAFDDALEEWAEYFDVVLAGDFDDDWDEEEANGV